MEQTTYAHSRSGYTNGEANGADSYALGLPLGHDAVPHYEKSTNPDPLSEESLKQFFGAMWTSADEHRQPRKVIWDQCWALYNNQFDFSQKAFWQHRVAIPKIRTAVDKATAIFRKTLLRMYPFYGIQSESKMGRTKGRYSMLLTDYWFDQINVIDEMVKSFKVGLVTSVIPLKIWMARVQDFELEVATDLHETPNYEFGVQTGTTAQTKRTTKLKQTYKGQLGVQTLNPENIWIVPNTNFRGIIERFEITLNELISGAQSIDNEDPVYEKDAVERLKERASARPTVSDDNADRTGEGRITANTYLRTIECWHYWGDIFDNDGKLIMCNASFTLAEKDILIRKARENPFFHKDPPYVIGTPYTVPFSTYNRGLVEDVGEIAKSICEMANLIADGALYDAMKAFSIDVDQLDDPSEARQGLYPGKTFIRHSANAASPNEALVQTVDVGRVPTEAMNMIGLFEKYFQEGSYINEWVEGQGGKSGRTLGEVNLKTQAALEGLDEAARNIEVTVIEPTVAMSCKVIYQYHDNYMLQRLVDNYPQLSMLLQDMSPEERYITMIKDFSFKVRGLSVMIDRQQRIGELKEILTLLSYLPGFLEQLDPQATLEEILMPIGWDPRRLLRNGAAGGAVTSPTVGAAPQPPVALPPPGSMTGQRTPMQQRNADQGSRMGGATNNPQGQPNRALQYFLQNAMARNQTQGFFGGR